MWCEDFDPESFERQTLQTMTAALRARRNVQKHRKRTNLLLAYHTGAFAGAAFGGKLKPFDQYLNDTAVDKSAAQHAAGIAFFHRLKARGFPVQISRAVN